MNLSGADLSWTNLERADLSNADLTFANLFRVVFGEWHRGLSSRSPVYLKLREHNSGIAASDVVDYDNEKGWRRMYAANLSGANLSYANLTMAEMNHVDLSGAQIREATLSGARLMFANLREANLFESILSPASSHPMDMGANLSAADLTDANLGGCNCSGTDMTAAILHGTAFTTVFTGTKLWAATLSSASLTDNGRHPPIGLTQGQLDQSITPMEGNRPDLEGVMDPETGEQLVWRDVIPHHEKLRRAGHREWESEEDEEEDGGEKEDYEGENEPISS